MTNTASRERHSLRTVPDAIRRRVPFDCNGTLTGTTTLSGYGIMPRDKHMDQLALAYDAPDFYAVVSYATPIAWFADGKWTVPPTKYSPTTSRHQTAVRRGIA